MAVASEPSPPAGPLAGLRVVMLAGMGPTPFTGMVLADLGCEVLRVIRPPTRPGRELAPTDGLHAQQDVVNRGVDSVAVDLKDPAGVEAVLGLSEVADAFVEGFRPGVVERLGLGPDVVMARNRRIVYARLTGYGQTGPLAHQAGHDINYLAQSGVLFALASTGERPRPPINLLGDYAGGGLVAALGIVSAMLVSRTRGVGQVIDAAMIDGVSLLTAKLQGLRAAGLFSDEPGTNWLDSGAPFYDTYRCADGNYIAVGALEPDFYAQFVSRLGEDSDGWPRQDDRESWPLLRECIAQAVGRRTRDEWVEVFAGSDVCVSPVLTFDEAAAHSHNVARGLYTRIEGVLHPAPAPRFGVTATTGPSAPGTVPLTVGAVLAKWIAPPAGCNSHERTP